MKLPPFIAYPIEEVPNVVGPVLKSLIVALSANTPTAPSPILNISPLFRFNAPPILYIPVPSEPIPNIPSTLAFPPFEYIPMDFSPA